MRFRTPLILLIGAVLGSSLGWLIFSGTIDRDNLAQCVAYTISGAFTGVFWAMVILTKGTCDFTKRGREEMLCRQDRDIGVL